MGQHLSRLRCGPAFRRLQAVWVGPRDGARGPSQLPRDQVRDRAPL